MSLITFHDYCYYYNDYCCYYNGYCYYYALVSFHCPHAKEQVGVSSHQCSQSEKDRERKQTNLKLTIRHK